MNKNKYSARLMVNVVVAAFLCCSGQAAADADTALQSLEVPRAKVILTVDGLISHTNRNEQAQFDLAMIQALPASTIATSTVVTDGIKRFDGVLLRDLLSVLGVSDQAKHMDVISLNDYTVSIPLTDAYRYDVLLATHMDGQQLTPFDKGPTWIVYPRDQHKRLQDIRYDYRWVWQLKHLHIR